MSISLLTTEQIFQDMESIYQRAFADSQWRVALRAKEFQCKLLGLFQLQRVPGQKPVSTAALPPLQDQSRQVRRRQMKELLRRIGTANTPPDLSFPQQKKARIASG